MRCLVLLLAIAGTVCSDAQFPGGRPGGGMPQSPRGLFGRNMKELFGENSAFTANMQIDSKTQNGRATVPGKIFFLDGKSRFEMDASKMQRGDMPSGAAEQIKAMGMAEVVSITIPEKKESYLIYPGLKAYAVMPLNDTASTDRKPEVKKTELGKEKVDAHSTTKYNVVIKDDEGKERETLVWNASDLKDFPVKMQVNNESGSPSTITFSDVKLGKPDASLFTPPSDFQRYNDVQTMMRETMMKRFAPGSGFQPPK
jgi:hypothetical protein